jgi:predicted kinase
MKALVEFILPRIIGIMVHKKESLTPKERRAQESFMAKLQVKERRTKKPIIVAIIGLIGSGKNTVAKRFAEAIGATVIEGDEIRVQLRKQNERYEGTRKIAENVAEKVIKEGGNVVIDSDHIDQKKRASLREKARKAGVRLVLVRTYADRDVMIGRIMSNEYRSSVDDFFGGAGRKSKFKGKNPGAVVKLREMWRRTPHHYRWVSEGGGKWILKKLPFSIFAEINTTDLQHSKIEIQKTAKKLLAL